MNTLAPSAEALLSRGVALLSRGRSSALAASCASRVGFRVTVKLRIRYTTAFVCMLSAFFVAPRPSSTWHRWLHGRSLPSHSSITSTRRSPAVTGDTKCGLCDTNTAASPFSSGCAASVPSLARHQHAALEVDARRVEQDVDRDHRAVVGVVGAQQSLPGTADGTDAARRPVRCCSSFQFFASARRTASSSLPRNSGSSAANVPPQVALTRASAVTWAAAVMTCSTDRRQREPGRQRAERRNFRIVEELRQLPPPPCAAPPPPAGGWNPPR